MRRFTQAGWKRRIGLALTVLCAAVLEIHAQAPGNDGQNQPAANSTQNPAANSPGGQQKAKPQDPNAFPEDNDAVPVLPSANSPGNVPADTPPEKLDSVDYGDVPLASADTDPVRSPDDGGPATSPTGFSSSNQGMDDLLKPPPDEPGKHRKLSAPGEDHGMRHDSAKEDETVGAYYLGQKNWKGALSRFDSALVLDPENPDVYWGLGEAKRHLGDYAGAKANYLKLMEYDPDSKHAKDAKKILELPEMSNTKAVAVSGAVTQKP
jgi:tetratricopeptide (TPR) repeat protein